MRISEKSKKFLSSVIMVAMIVGVAVYGFIADDSPDDHQLDNLYAGTVYTEIPVDIDSTVPPAITSEKLYSAGILDLCFYLIDKPPPFYDEELKINGDIACIHIVTIGRILPCRFFCAVHYDYERNATHA